MEQANEEPSELTHDGPDAAVTDRHCSEDDRVRTAIERSHQQCVGAGIKFMIAMVICGILLLIAKRKVGFGHFSSWLATNFHDSVGLSHRTAQRYMRVATAFLAFAEVPFKDIKSIRQVKTLLELPISEEFYQSYMSVQEVSSDPNAWDTDSAIIKAASDVLGGIDVDPCASSHVGGIRFAETNYTAVDDGLSDGADWSGTALVVPGHKGDLSLWYVKAQTELEKGNLTAAIVCLPVTSINNKTGSVSVPFVLTNSPLEATFHPENKASEQAEPITRRLPTRSILLYVAKEPDIEKFARAFRDIGVAFVPQLSGGAVIEVEPLIHQMKRIEAEIN